MKRLFLLPLIVVLATLSATAQQQLTIQQAFDSLNRRIFLVDSVRRADNNMLRAQLSTARDSVQKLQTALSAVRTEVNNLPTVQPGKWITYDNLTKCFTLTNDVWAEVMAVIGRATFKLTPILN